MKLTVNGNPIQLEKLKFNNARQLESKRVPCTTEGVPLSRGHVMLDGTVVRGTSRINAERTDIKPAMRDLTLRKAEPEELLWLEVESVYSSEYKPDQLELSVFRYQSSPHDSWIVFFPDGFAVVGKPLEGE